MARKPPKVRMMRPRLKAMDHRTVKPMDPRTYAARRKADPAMAFYGTSAWQTMRKEVVEERGYRCEDCGTVPSRIYCDHVVELKDGGAPLDKTNIRLRCGSCHTTKTLRARGERMGLL